MIFVFQICDICVSFPLFVLLYMGGNLFFVKHVTYIMLKKEEVVIVFLSL